MISGCSALGVVDGDLVNAGFEGREAPMGPDSLWTCCSVSPWSAVSDDTSGSLCACSSVSSSSAASDDTSDSLCRCSSVSSSSDADDDTSDSSSESISHSSSAKT